MALTAGAGLIVPVAAAAPAPRAVIIVGPSGMDRQNKVDAARIADEARAVGMRVTLIETPHATWSRVVPALQGASLLVYLGHGNGYPGPHGSNEDTHDGLGLNPRDGVHSPTDYQGANQLRKRVRLARNAVVLLYHLCYASGNGEEYMGPEFRRSVAVPRADNFASGFLDIGARAVFAYGTDQGVDLPRALMHGDQTMDQIFKSRAGYSLAAYSGFVGTSDYYGDSTRTAWARLHMDPHPTKGHYRALTGDLSMRASDFRAGAGTTFVPWRPAPDHVAPVLTVRRTDGSAIAGGTITLTPNGDHSGDVLRLRTNLSEQARVWVEIRNRRGRLIRSSGGDASRGAGVISWAGRGDDGQPVSEGHYRMTITPTDAAGNKGLTRTVQVLVLTSLGHVGTSPSALDAADRDRLARSVRIGFTLTHRAHVRVAIEDAHGAVVRTGIQGRSMPAGRRGWTWDGRDDRGRFVPSGDYVTVVTASTSVGTLRTRRSIHVGPYRVGVSDGTPARGQRVRIRVDATERQRGAPTLVLTQAGGIQRVVHTESDHRGGYVASIRLRSGGGMGVLRIRVVGKDQHGQRESETRELPLH
jgi:flagellar hook assembly protein FlgD